MAPDGGERDAPCGQVRGAQAALITAGGGAAAEAGVEAGVEAGLVCQEGPFSSLYIVFMEMNTNMHLKTRSTLHIMYLVIY